MAQHLAGLVDGLGKSIARLEAADDPDDLRADGGCTHRAWETVDTAIEGPTATRTGVWQECQVCGGLRFQERPVLSPGGTDGE